MKEKLHNFVYLSTNKINGKKYVGDHSTNNLGDGYFGSGKYFLRALKEYGKENFEIKILEFFSSKEEAFNAQERYIKEHNTLFPDGYNLDSKGGFHYQILSENTKNKMKIPKTLEHKKKLKDAWIERRKRKISKETRDKNRKSHLGKKQSQECKDKIGKANSSRIWKEESREKLRLKKSGSQLSEETKKLIGKKIPCIYCGKEMNAGNLSRYHNENCKLKPISQISFLLIRK